MRLEFTYRFEAAHRFLHSSSIPCMTPHGHSWYASLALRFLGSELNPQQMTVEFTQVKKDFRKLVQDTFDHSFLHHYQDPIVPVLLESHVEMRLLPFPGDPTTELISLFLFHKSQLMIKKNKLDSLLQTETLILQETPTNKIYCDRDFYLKEIEKYQHDKAWWNSDSPTDRSWQK
jgi:6-pyruvoyl-tetrahydropterin synthase